MRILRAAVLSAAMLTLASVHAQTNGKWTLNECIKYALENNISLKKKKIALEEANVDTKTARAALFPSLSFSTNQNATNRPFSESTTNLTSGSMTVTTSKTTYNGNYGLNAQWLLYNGGKNTKNVKQQDINRKIAELAIDESANTIEKQIATLYVQTLYSADAIEVNKKILETSLQNRDRGEEMEKAGLLSKSELAQLESQVSQDQYNLVSSQATLENYKLQLKQLLELGGEVDFDIVAIDANDAEALAAIPSKETIYNAALESRPEIQSAKLATNRSDLAVSIAKAGYMPTLSATAGIGTSNSSGLHGTSFGKQIKNNLNNSIGLTLSVPIFNGRETKSAVEKAKLQQTSSRLDLLEQQKNLYSDIANLWLDANSAQKKYVAAKENTKSTQTSYDLVNEQFRVGLKNVSDVSKQKDQLLQAKQSELQSKYTSILDVQLLKFYTGESINM